VRLNGAKQNPSATKKAASSIQNYTHIKGNVEYLSNREKKNQEIRISFVCFVPELVEH
jgi:hypothetical protein